MGMTPAPTLPDAIRKAKAILGELPVPSSSRRGVRPPRSGRVTPRPTTSCAPVMCTRWKMRRGTRNPGGGRRCDMHAFWNPEDIARRCWLRA